VSQRFEGKVAFITGAARGQGRALAVRLASEGADILAIDICGPVMDLSYPPSTPDDLAQTEKLVRDLGRNIFTAQADVRDLGAVERAVSEGLQVLGRLDFVAANAAIVSYGRAWELTPEQWQTTLDVNLTGVWNTLRPVIPYLIEQGDGGAIVITSSVAGLRGLPLMAHYVASKYGVVGLAQTLANELGEHQIRVNTIHPYGVRTPMTEGDETFGTMMKDHPLLQPMLMTAMKGSPVEPEDIVAVTAFLFSDEGRHITATAVPIDLGTMAR
jgi:SDR family mycofactocin-dependent oxidoreductase